MCKLFDKTGCQEAVFENLCVNLGGPQAVVQILQKEAQSRSEQSPSLIGCNGRVIERPDLASPVYPPDLSYKLVQPVSELLDYERIMNRLTRFFPDLDFLPVPQFRVRTERLLKQLQTDFRLNRLLNGPWFPVCYPHFEVTNYQADLENVFFEALMYSYQSTFKERKFLDYRDLLKNNFRWCFDTIEASHQKFLDRMSCESFVGIQFFPFQGYSPEAERKMMSSLPESLSLSGPLDIATALTVFPEVLAFDSMTMGYNCSGVYCPNSGQSSLSFEPSDRNLQTSLNLELNHLPSRYSGGLVYTGYSDFLGPC